MQNCKEHECYAKPKYIGLCQYHYHKDYRIKNKSKILSKRIEWNSNNKEKIAKYQKKYISANPEIDRNKDRKRRALKKQNGFEKYTEKEVLEKYGLICYLCDKIIDLEAPRQSGKLGWENGLHIEHVIDIAKGGSDTLENVRPSHGLCNLKKKPRQVV
jgi:hypothetical protein